MSTSVVAEIRSLLHGCTAQERQELFDELSRTCQLHALEQEWNVPARVVLDAIARSSDLTQRGIRGVIAEAVFSADVVTPLTNNGWIAVATIGDVPYDFHLQDASGSIRIQVKMQRRKEQRPMFAVEANKYFRSSGQMYVVETQKTRGGKDADGANTRPYRFGEFDILAVSLHPSTSDWTRFRYSLCRLLMPDPVDKALLFKYQAVPLAPNEQWTDSLDECIQWLRSDKCLSSPSRDGFNDLLPKL